MEKGMASEISLQVTKEDCEHTLLEFGISSCRALIFSLILSLRRCEDKTTRQMSESPENFAPSSLEEHEQK
jgi:hypothetical protein